MMLLAYAVQFVALTHPASAQTPAIIADPEAIVPACAEDASWSGETGVASFYGQAHQGRRTAGGTRFDQKAMTAAHPWLPFGTRVRVTLRNSSQSVLVTITDRLPASRRVIDVSLGAARTLGFIGRGVAQVSLSPG